MNIQILYSKRYLIELLFSSPGECEMKSFKLEEIITFQWSGSLDIVAETIRCLVKDVSLLVVKHGADSYPDFQLPFQPVVSLVI